MNKLSKDEIELLRRLNITDEELPSWNPLKDVVGYQFLKAKRKNDKYDESFFSRLDDFAEWKKQHNNHK